MSKKKAKELVAMFTKERIEGKFHKKMFRSIVAKQLTERINNPHLIDQASASLCGPAALMYTLAHLKPDIYVQYVIDLYNKGQARLGTLEIKPSKDCRNYYPRDDRKVKYKDQISECDWIALASLRDSENKILEYDSARDKTSGITFPGQIKKMVSRSRIQSYP